MIDQRVKERLRGRALSRGFTLTELMAVVAIIGVLAALGIAKLRNGARQSNTATAVVVVKSIAAAEEQFRALNQVYLNVSSDNTWYPREIVPPNTRISFWNTGAADDERWKQLRPDIRQPVDFVFMANAGLPSDALPAISTGAGSINRPANVSEPWYLIRARADADDDHVYSVVAAVSWMPEVVTSNEGE